MTFRAKVVLVKCHNYEFSAVYPAVERLFATLGGIEALIKSGQTVLIKPNLLSDHRPEEAVTTHPEIVRALIRLVKQAGGIPSVADSAAASMDLESVWEKTGFRAMCAEEAVPLLNLEKAGSRRFDCNGVSFSIANPVLEADVVINVPKLKTHVLTVLTNAVKNMYGAIPGYQKTMLHKQYPDAVAFGRFLATLYGIARPTLTVTDAIVAMEGSGPLAGNLVSYGFLAASTDGVALDTMMCHLLKINPSRVPYFHFLKEAGTGETKWQEIDLAGDPPGRLGLRPIRLPNGIAGKVIPDWLYPLVWPLLWIRPEITARCVACGLCVKACPVGALSQAKGERPVLNRKLCIQCCCCHEVCPAKAINMRLSPLFAIRQYALLWIMHSQETLKKLRRLGRAHS
jgi:uncharacterized protein (DUF362 family)/NAD-dependent dihydropyrimidine dehydrogenase PreA subunit